MTIEAQLADGRVLEFPDGTNPSVIQATVKRMLAPAAPPAAPKAGFSPADTALSFGQGVIGAGKSLTDIFGADNAVSEALGKGQKYLGEQMTPGRQAEIAARQEKIKAAEGTGFLNEVGAELGAIKDAPIQGTAQALGSIAPYLATSLVGAAVKLLPATVRIINTIVGAAQGAGSIKGSIYDTVYEELVNKGIPEAKAKEQAALAQSYNSKNALDIAAGSALGAVGARTGVESQLIKGAGEKASAKFLPRVGTAMLKEAPMEGGQGAQEKVAQNRALQKEGFDVPTFQGVAGRAAGDAALGALAAGAVGATQGPKAVAPPPAPVAETPPAPAAPAKPTYEELQARIEALQAQPNSKARNRQIKALRTQMEAMPAQGELPGTQVPQALEPEKDLRGKPVLPKAEQPTEVKPTPQELEAAGQQTMDLGDVPMSAPITMTDLEGLGGTSASISKANRQWLADNVVGKTPEAVTTFAQQYPQLIPANRFVKTVLKNLAATNAPKEYVNESPTLPKVQPANGARGRKPSVGVPVQPAVDTTQPAGAAPTTGAPAEPSGQRLVPPQQPVSTGNAQQGAQPSSLGTSPESAIVRAVQEAVQAGDTPESRGKIVAIAQKLGIAIPENTPIKTAVVQLVTGVQKRAATPPNAPVVTPVKYVEAGSGDPNLTFNQGGKQFVLSSSGDKPQLVVRDPNSKSGVSVFYAEGKNFDNRRNVHAAAELAAMHPELPTNLVDALTLWLGSSGKNKQFLGSNVAATLNLATRPKAAPTAPAPAPVVTPPAPAPAPAPVVTPKPLPKPPKVSEATRATATAEVPKVVETAAAEGETPEEKSKRELKLEEDRQARSAAQKAQREAQLEVTMDDAAKAVREAPDEQLKPEHAEAVDELDAKLNLYDTSEEIVKAQRAAAYIDAVAKNPLTPMAVRQYAQNIVDSQLDPVDIAAGRKKAGDKGVLYQYKASDPNAPSLTQKEVHTLATNLINNWKNIPAELIVHEREDTLPQDIRAQAKKDGMTGKITGVYDTAKDTVHLVAENLKTPQDVQNAVVHEIVGHFGLRSVLGDSYDNVMDRLYEGNKAVREAAAEKMQGENPLDQRTAVEEVLAEMAETGPEAPLPPAAKGALRRIYDLIKQWFRTKLKIPEPVSDDAVRQIVANARRYVSNGNIQGTTTQLKNTGAVLYATKKAAPVAATAPGTPGPTIAQRAKQLMPPPTGIKAAITAATNNALQAMGPAQGIDVVTKLRTQVVDKYAAVAQRLATLYDGAVRDAAGKVNATVIARQAEDAAKMLPMFFEEGGIRIGTAGLLETYKAKTAPTEVYTVLQKWAKQNGLDFETAYAQASIILEGMRLDALMKAKADVLIHWRTANKQVDTVRIAEAVAAYNASPELQEMSRIMDEPRIALVNQLEKSGRLTAEDAQFYRDAINYVPFDRIEDFNAKFTSRKRMTGRGVSQLGKLPELIGSEERPVGNVFDNYFKTMGWMVQQFAKQNANTELMLAMTSLQLAKPLGDNEKSPTGYSIMVYRDGAPKNFSVPTKYDQAAFADEPRIIPSYVRFMSRFSKTLRLLVTANPAFALSQVVQDVQGALLTSGVRDPLPFTMAVFGNFAKLSWHEIKGLSSDLTGQDSKLHDIEREFGRTGLAGAVDFTAPTPATNILYDLGLRKRSKLSAIVNRLERITQASDIAVRKAVYDFTLEQTKSTAYPLGDKLLANTRARELINFHRRGTSGTMQDLIMTVPFLNATAQSMDLLYRAATGVDNASGLQQAEARKMFLKHVAVYAGAALAYAMAKAGDDEYEKLDRRTRDNNWILGDGVKIAIRGDIAVVKVAIENAIGYYRRQGTPEEQLASEMVLSTLQYAREQYVGRINIIPTAIRPVVENLFNYSTLTGRPLEGTYQQGILPHERVSKGTSELAKSIAEYLAGNGVEISPIKIDNALKGYFGTSAASVIMLTDAMLHPEAVDRPMSKWMGLSGFMYDKSQMTNPKDEFYDLRAKVIPIQKTLTDIAATDVVKAEAFYQEHQEELVLASTITHTLSQLAQVRKYRKWLNGTDAEATMSKAEREKEMDSLLPYETDMVSWVRAAKLEANRMFNTPAKP